MKTVLNRLLIALAFLARVHQAGAQDTAFTYQGRLTTGTSAANGLFDLRLSLYGGNFGGSPVAGPITNSSVVVSNGLFVTSIDFGAGVFNGSNLWLEVATRSNSLLTFATISPRQLLGPAPYAIFAQNAGTAGSVTGLQIQQNGTSPNLIGGYSGNAVSGGAVGATIGGGGEAGSVNQAQANYTTVGGGLQNTANGTEATVSGGANNTAFASGSTVGGGTYNTAGAANSTVGGGYQNVVGSGNGANGTIGGGAQNTAAGWAAVAGGQLNNAAGFNAAIGGGSNNVASGYAAAVPGGQNNVASGINSFASGYNAQATNDNTFVWSDGSADTSSTTNNQFMARASNGCVFYTSSGNGAGVWLASGSGSWSSLSDRNSKDNFVQVDAQTVLAKVLAMPVSTWNYKTQNKNIRHIGPMAQDFYAAFKVGEDDKRITTVDEEGVALAAIQGLNQEVEKKSAEIEQLKQSVAELKEMVNRLAAKEQHSDAK